MLKKVSILGCGWVGKALKARLSILYPVYCLSRDIEQNKEANFYHCNVLVIAIPPRDSYLEVLKQTLEWVDISTQVILLSSISFYDKKFLVVEAENLLQKLHQSTIILRLGGLMGYTRVAGKYTAGKVLASNSRTNYVHRDDVVNIIKTLIEKDIRNEIFDIVAPIQCVKKEIFSQNAKVFGFKETEFLTEEIVGKRLSPKKICKMLNYVFLKNDVSEFWSK